MESSRIPGRFAFRATLVLLSGSIAIALAIGEGAVRFFRPQFVAGPDASLSPFWRHDPELGWSHPPAVEGLFVREEFSHHVRINSSGWRDHERSHEKRPGLFRIAVLGDSFTWGHGVGDEEIYTRVMERMSPDVEVLNFAVGA